MIVLILSTKWTEATMESKVLYYMWVKGSVILSDEIGSYHIT